MLLLTLLALAAYRLYRLLALDTLPPLVWARKHTEDFLQEHLGDDWADGLTCPWCLGFWCAVVVVWCVDVFVVVPLPALQIAAVSCIVGLIGANLDHG